MHLFLHHFDPYLRIRDIQNHANERGIKPMSHTMKLWERVIDQRLRRVSDFVENGILFFKIPDDTLMSSIYA